MRIVYHDKVVDADRVVRIDEKLRELDRQKESLANAELAVRQALSDERETFLRERDEWLEAASAARLIAWKQAENESVAQDRVLGIAMLVAEKIVCEELRLHPELVQSFVRDTLAKYRAEQSLTLRVHPLDVALLPDLGPHVEIQADQNLARGDVVIDGPNGNVDARIRTRLERIEHALQRSD